MVFNKKSLIAAAIAGAFAFPIAAQAQTSVVVYGKIYPQLTSVNLSDATRTGAVVSTLGAPATGVADINQFSMDSPNSRLGFRGTEALGGGMRAFFQLEMGFGVDTGASGSSTSLFNRDSFVGVAGNFGSVQLGNFDTVYKQVGDKLSFLGISSGNFMTVSTVISKAGFGTSSSSSFHLRRANSIQYTTPEVAGFQGLLGYSLGEVAGNPARNSLVSGGVTYRAGPLYVALAHEVHNDFFGGSRNVPAAISNTTNTGANSTDTATRLTVQYRFLPTTRAEVNFAQMEYDETSGLTGRFQNYKHNAWSVGAEHRIGATNLVATYGQSLAGSCRLVGVSTCNTSGLDGRMLNIGAGYDLSKRTMVYAVFSRLENGSSAVYSNLNSGRPATGQDIDTFAVGLSHTF